MGRDQNLAKEEHCRQYAMSTAPLGWENNWVSQAQIYPGYGGDSDNGLNKTVQAFSGASFNPLQRPVPGDRDALNGYMTYFGDGTVAVNRQGLIAPKDLVDNNKMSWKISQDMGQRFHPLMKVYMNDASTSESAFNLLTDLSSTGGTTNKKSIPVNIYKHCVAGGRTAGSAHLGCKSGCWHPQSVIHSLGQDADRSA